jgi:xanthine dehydrogenase accessory factor
VSPSVDARAAELRARRSPFVLAVVVRAERPTSAKPGDRAIVLPDGTIEGFVGGSCAESTVRVQSLRQLEAGASTLLRITPGGGRSSEAPGLVVVDNECLSGGTIEVFLEAVMPPPLLQVYGDTPIARALVAVGTAAGYEVRLVRPGGAGFSMPTDSPGIGSRHSPVAADALGVVVASHGHGEEEVLAAAVGAGIPYVALVASPKRGPAVVADAGVPADRVKTPAGLDLGARTPGDVAVSILAEVAAARSARPAPAASPLLRIGVGVPAAPEIAVDPVCHMDVVVSPEALQLEHAGRTWYFCAPGCRTAFAADPARYGA